MAKPAPKPEEPEIDEKPVDASKIAVPQPNDDTAHNKNSYAQYHV